MTVLKWLSFQWEHAKSEPAFWMLCIVLGAVMLILYVTRQRDADFTCLTWEGWDDGLAVSVDSKTKDCADAVDALTAQGYVITGINRSARILNICTPGRIVAGAKRAYDSSAPREGFLQTTLRNCTHGERQARH